MCVTATETAISVQTYPSLRFLTSNLIVSDTFQKTSLMQNFKMRGNSRHGFGEVVVEFCIMVEEGVYLLGGTQ